MSTGYDARSVANAILIEAWRQGKELTIMQLLKLVYFAHGWSLALLNRPLISDPIEAWQYGPVVPSVYKALPGAGSKVISSEIKIDGFPLIPSLDAQEVEIVKSIVKNYGDLHAFQLSELTHTPKSPWSQTPQYQSIPNQIIRDYFASLGKS